MKNVKKLVGMLLAVAVLIGLFAGLVPYEGILADSGLEYKDDECPEIPKITIKKVMSGTGVKIKVAATKGADGYEIQLVSAKNANSSYRRDKGEGIDRIIGKIEKKGNKKRTFITGLPKGTYTFRVRAYKKVKAKWVEYEDEEWFDTYLFSEYSVEKTVKIKAAKTSKAKEKTYDFSNTNVGDVIKLGSYEQDADFTNGTEDIEWIVLSKDSEKMLVVSKHVLDYVDDHNEYGSIYGTPYESSSLRDWLTEVFYNSAFSKKEKKLVLKEKTQNNDTVFLLSSEDVINPDYGFSKKGGDSDISRRCTATRYAKIQGAYSREQDYYDDWKEDSLSGEPTCSWKILGGGKVKAVSWDGNAYGSTIDAGIRPAIYLSLK